MNTAHKLLELLKVLYTDGTLHDCYGVEREVGLGEGAPLECALEEWKAAGYPVGQRWRSIEGEGAPDVGRPVLVWWKAPGVHQPSASLVVWGSEIVRTHAAIGIRYTHWMPLPSGPEEG